MRQRTSIFTCRATAMLLGRRQFSGLGEGNAGSILGTSSLSGDLLKGLQEDMQREQNIRKHGIGETLVNYVHRAELSHMESPEADQKFLEKFGSQVDDFFAKIPLPEDPMKAALARSPEEMEEEASTELLREAVREAYLRKLDAKTAEELRLKQAMKRAQQRGYQPLSEEERRWDPDKEAAGKLDAAAVRAAVEKAERAKARSEEGKEGGGAYHPPTNTAKARREKTLEEEVEELADGLDERALQKEMLDMQQKMRMMEALLRAKQGRSTAGTPTKDE